MPVSGGDFTHLSRGRCGASLRSDKHLPSHDRMQPSISTMSSKTPVPVFLKLYDLNSLRLHAKHNGIQAERQQFRQLGAIRALILSCLGVFVVQRNEKAERLGPYQRTSGELHKLLNGETKCAENIRCQRQGTHSKDLRT